MDVTLIEILSGVLVLIFSIVGVILRKNLQDVLKKLKKSEEESKPEDIGKSMLCDKMITDVIAEQRVTANADRSYIFQFHNGSFFTGKQPVWKLSCTHESAGHGVTYEMGNLQGIGVANILDILIPFWGEHTDGCTRIDCTQKNPDPRMGVYKFVVSEMERNLSRLSLEAQNIEEMVITPLVSPKDDRVIGLFGLDYVHTPTYPADLSAFSEGIKNCSSTISYLITRKQDEGCEGTAK